MVMLSGVAQSQPPFIIKSIFNLIAMYAIYNFPCCQDIQETVARQQRKFKAFTEYHYKVGVNESYQWAQSALSGKIRPLVEKQ